MGEGEILLGIDFNLTLNFEIDAHRYVRENNKASRQNLDNLLNDYYLLNDAYRCKNPRRRKFTWFNPSEDSRQKGRIDYFLLPYTLINL